MIRSSSIGAGHGKQDSKSAGASSSLMKESIANREVKDEVIRLLKENSVTTYDTTVDYPNSKSDCLNKIVNLCNKHNTDLDVSIHFNSAANDIDGNGKSTGVECWIYSPNSDSKPYAERICKRISELGFKNRGVKYSKEFTVLKTKNPCVIVEICFLDDLDDVNIYNKNKDKIPYAIVEGILGRSISSNINANNNNNSNTSFKNGDYSGRKAKATGDGLRVRYDRGTNFNILSQVNKNHVFELEYCLNKWVSVKGYKGNKGLGYVHTDYLELI